MNVATSEGTKRYASRNETAGRAAPGHYSTRLGLSLSSLGIGTYLGDADDATDILYAEAVSEALRLGCNVVDTAINYRFQRSERAIGTALERLLASGEIRRDEVVIATKGGYVPFDREAPRSAAEFRKYLDTTFFAPGVCRADEMCSNGQHCMSPGYLSHQLDRSLANLGVEAVDVYYVHNPEGQIAEVGRDEFERRLRAAFERLELAVADGKLARYGTATWNGYRVAPASREYLSLERLVAIAEEVGGPTHHFRVVQLPYNLAMPEAYGFANQARGGSWNSLLEAADDLGIAVFCSAPLLQSRLAGAAPSDVSVALGFEDGAKCALQFVRSTPGVAAALVGSKRIAHVRTNMELARIAPRPATAIEALFEGDGAE